MLKLSQAPFFSVSSSGLCVLAYLSYGKSCHLSIRKIILAVKTYVQLKQFTVLESKDEEIVSYYSSHKATHHQEKSVALRMPQ